MQQGHLESHKVSLKKSNPKNNNFSRDELKQFEMKKEFKNVNLRYFIGDVRDYNNLMLLAG